MAYTFNPFTGNFDFYGSNRLTYTDDGTYISVKAGTTILFKYRKSDKQIIVSSGLDTDGGF